MAILRVYNPLTESWDPIPYIKGDKGDRGYDVTTVEYEYYSSTSSSETIGGEWSTIMPGYSEGRYIWVRTKTTNSHGEVYTGTPILATLFNDVNSAELTRRTYETNRVNAETARNTAEGLRDSAEIARASAELLRVSAETSRGNSEVSRANAEAQRVSAESSRVSVEAQRVANEEQRISNENARIAAQGRYPIVQNSTWWVWSKEDDDYVDTEVTAVGANGVGIASIELTSTADLVDTYTITFDDGNTTSFDVTNGADGFSPVITVTSITGGHEVEVVDAQGTQTFDVMDGEVSEQDLEDALIDKADIITSSASGEIVTIADGGNDMPVVDLKVSLLPVQSGSGDPSPDNVRPISGWTGVEVYQRNANLCALPVIAQSQVAVNKSNCFFIKKGTYYLLLSSPTNCTSARACVYMFNKDGTALLDSAHKPNPGFANTGTYWRYGGDASFSIHHVLTFIEDCYIRITIGLGDVVSTSKADGMLCVGDYSAYVPYVGQTYPISWQSSAGTVYGGSLDVTTGVLSVDEKFRTLTSLDATYSNVGESVICAYFTASDLRSNSRTRGISNYFKPVSTVIGTVVPWVCTFGINNQRIYFTFNPNIVGGTTLEDINSYVADHPIEICYPLATPLTYQLSENQISTLLGTNNFWSNGNGSLDLEYRADTKLYIEQLTKPSEDDMTANANIASGRFFMVGNRLMLSTTAIAQGEQIVVGTNCSEVSLADALNQINA